MFRFLILAAALSSAVACAADNPAIGKWKCTNSSDTGTESTWTLVLHQDSGKLAGFLTDGEVQIGLSGIQLKGADFAFQFSVNDKPYGFAGKLEGEKLEGRYKGDEASGKLRCTKPAAS